MSKCKGCGHDKLWHWREKVKKSGHWWKPNLWYNLTGEGRCHVVGAGGIFGTYCPCLEYEQ